MECLEQFSRVQKYCETRPPPPPVCFWCCSHGVGSPPPGGTQPRLTASVETQARPQPAALEISYTVPCLVVSGKLHAPCLGTPQSLTHHSTEKRSDTQEPGTPHRAAVQAGLVG